MRQYRCRALGCWEQISARRLLCERHWRMVSRETQRAVLRGYLRDQQSGLRTPGHAVAVRKALREVQGAPTPEGLG